MDTLFSDIPNEFDESTVNFFVVKPQTIWFNVGLCHKNMPNSLRELFETYPRFINHLATKYGTWEKNNESFIEVQRVVTSNNCKTIVNTVTLPLDDLFDIIYKINVTRANTINVPRANKINS